MTIIVNLRKKEIAFEEDAISVKQLLKRLDLSPQAYLVVRNGDLLTENEIVKQGDDVRIIAVISGG